MPSSAERHSNPQRAARAHHEATARGRSHSRFAGISEVLGDHDTPPFLRLQVRLPMRVFALQPGKPRAIGRVDLHTVASVAMTHIRKTTHFTEGRNPWRGCRETSQGFERIDYPACAFSSIHLRGRLAGMLGLVQETAAPPDLSDIEQAGSFGSRSPHSGASLRARAGAGT